jgi:sulfonate transport system ATP-binding protein
MTATLRVVEPSAPTAPLPGAGHGLQLGFDGVAKSFGPRAVLENLSLDVPAGQFLAIAGRSGCGKSTLLRLVAGLERPDRGQIRIGDEVLAGLSPSVRLLFQDPRLLPWQRVGSNVGIARGPGWQQRAERALESVGLADRFGEWPSVLSGGQRQRVALARALVSRPSVLLLDEPFGALDAITRVEMQQLLLRLWEETGFTAILITHDVGEAVALADRVLVLRDGGIALDVAVDVPRSQRATDPAAAALERRILAAV